MSITSYSGLMGAGKTYEVVAYVIVPAICSGRRVITNIAGISPEELVSYCVTHKKADKDKLGQIVSISDDDVNSPEFFPGEGRASSVQPGDLVVIDEAWKFWGSGPKLKEEHFAFFRLHRHHIHKDTNISCDIVLITQDINDLHRSLKQVVELSFRAKKLKTLGLYNRYCVEMWDSPKQSRASVSSQTRKYDPNIFPIYKSYSAGKGPGKELVVDNRQNITKSWKVIVGIPVLVLVAILCFSYSFSFFKPTPVSAQVKHSESPVASVSSNAKDAGKSQLSVEMRKPPKLSTDWRLAGYFEVGERKRIILVNNAGRVRYETASTFSFEDGRPVAGLVDGERVTPWSGSLSSSEASKTVLGTSLLKE